MKKRRRDRERRGGKVISFRHAHGIQQRKEDQGEKKEKEQSGCWNAVQSPSQGRSVSIVVLWR